MSDLSRAWPQLPNGQPPVGAYFDEKFYQHELQTLFKCGPRYMGHELMVPEVGDYFSLPSERNARVLVRQKNQTVELLSNVCRHRQAILLDGQGHTENIVCPLHRWTYALNGELLGAPHFAENPCLNLDRTPLHNWRGLLFDANGRDPQHDLATLSNAYFDFSEYRFDHVEVHECNYNWKTFVEVYLEDYHVAPFHPGLSHFVSCDQLEWQFGDRYSMQTVGVHQAFTQAGSPAYRKWQEALLRFGAGKVPQHGAIWMMYYPNLMIEWYPYALVVSTLIPRGPRRTTNIIEFYYPEEIALFEPELIAAERAAYMETVAEDDEIARRMDAGREALLERGMSQVGPYQSPLEDGMRHFHQFLRQQLCNIEESLAA